MVKEVHGPAHGGERSVAGLAGFLESRGLMTKRGAYNLLWAWWP